MPCIIKKLLILILMGVSPLILAQEFKVAIAVKSEEASLGPYLNRLLIERLSFLSQHLASKEEYLGYYQKAYRQAEAKLLEQLNTNKQQQDHWYFEKNNSYDTLNALKEQETSLKHSLKHIKIDIPSLLWPIIWDTETYGALDETLIKTQSSVMLWLYGNIYELRPGLIAVDLSLYNSLTGKTEPLFQQTTPIKDLEKLADELALTMASAILGRKWASFTLKGNLEGTTLFLNEEKIYNTDALRFLPVGTYLLQIEKPGFQPFGVKYTLQASQIQPINYTPVMDNTWRTYSINTNPIGANIFIDGTYIGLSPHSLEGVPGSLVVIQKMGFNPIFYQLGKNQTLIFNFNKDALVLKTEKLSQGFHISYAFFIASTAAPIVLFSLQNKAYQKAILYQAAGQTTQAIFWQKKANTYLIAGSSTAGVSAVLLGVSLSQLYRLVKAKEALTQ